MQNKLSDLNNHLFMQLERLGDESLTPEELAQEIKRSQAIGGISKNIIENANLVYQAKRTSLEYDLGEDARKALIGE